jgi:hypothetical protein
MEKDWNLKEYEEHIKLEGIGTLGSFTRIEYNNIGGAKVENLHSLTMRYFCPSIIDLLHKQLIEDFMELFGHETGGTMGEIEQVINKRFGKGNALII